MNTMSTLILILFSYVGFGQVSVDVAAPLTERYLGKKTYWLSGTLTFETIQQMESSQFELGDRDIMSFGNDPSPYWYRI